MEPLNTGTFLLYEWMKTLLIFTLIDKIIIRKKTKEILQNHDTYISSLVVAAFLLVIKNQQNTFGSFIIWSVLSLLIYIMLKAISRIFFKL